MTEKRFLKEHYEEIESLAYCGMVFWFVPFILAVASYGNNGLVCNNFVNGFIFIMFFLHMGLVICFDDDKLWRWIK